MSTSRTARQRLREIAPLSLVLLLALALRLLLWGRIPRTGLIADEGEYLSAASWLAHGRGFTWYQSYLWTRAPLYPLFVAAHLRLFGDTPTPIYATQTLLSLLNIVLVYVLALRLTTDGRVTRSSLLDPPGGSRLLIPTLAALLMAVYFPFALYTQVLLSETLFIALLLAGFLALANWQQAAGESGDWGVAIGDSNPQSPIAKRSREVGGRWWLVAAGGLFGLATLTRSLTLAFLPIAALWIAGAGRGAARGRWGLSRRGIASGAVFLACAALVVLPWTAYNSRLYGGLVVVDTSGAFNLLLGARTGYDGSRSDAATRDFLRAFLDARLPADAAERRKLLDVQRAADGSPIRDSACLLRRNDARLLDALSRPVATITQAERQQLMTAEALCLLGAKPWSFAAKSLAELVDLFQINYTGAERFTDDFTSGRLPPWYTLGLFVLDDTIYVLLLPLAVIGWALMRRSQVAACRLQIEDRHDRRSVLCNVQSAIGLWWLYNIAVAPLLFAINRFRLPLLPFAFIFAAHAIVSLPRVGWRGLRPSVGAGALMLAALLLLIAATPYAYLQAAPSSWASYMGPYPSSLAASTIALDQRPLYLRGERFRAALAADPPAARAILEAGPIAMPRADGISVDATTLGRALLLGREGRAADGLALLPALSVITATRDIEAAVVRGDLLRSEGDLAGARLTFTQQAVDDNNPVQWAWDWLHPAPLPNTKIDLAGNLDLGYIQGCYLGEGDSEARGNFRWCTDGAQLRFPGAGAGAPQTLALRADGRGWFDRVLPVPPVRVFVGEQLAGEFTPDSEHVREFTITLPSVPRGADVVVTLRTDTFVPGADRYLSQQGRSVVGLVQRLGVRLDWAELRPAAQR
jgi:4-amino-4-deoxy-L-arabinose transferase-like glycosyltransferase